MESSGMEDLENGASVLESPAETVTTTSTTVVPRIVDVTVAMSPINLVRLSMAPKRAATTAPAPTVEKPAQDVGSSTQQNTTRPVENPQKGKAKPKQGSAAGKPNLHSQMSHPPASHNQQHHQQHNVHHLNQHNQSSIKHFHQHIQQHQHTQQNNTNKDVNGRQPQKQNSLPTQNAKSQIKVSSFLFNFDLSKFS
jgi:hypothetical protein